MPCDTPCGGVDVTSEGIVRSTEEREGGGRRHREVVSAEVEAGTEGSRAIR